MIFLNCRAYNNFSLCYLNRAGGARNPHTERKGPFKMGITSPQPKIIFSGSGKYSMNEFKVICMATKMSEAAVLL